MKCRKIIFQQKGDERGSLVVIESNKDIPFEIKRVFYMINTLNDVARGQHANIESDFIDSYEKDDIFILYCRSGNRSGQAAKILSDNEYNLVFDAGGISSYSGELE